MRLAFLLSFTLYVAAQAASAGDPPERWWRGNLHTHSLWSDGDDFPEMIGDWYRDHDYHFLALSDHNVLSEGQRWMSVKKVAARSDETTLQKYRDRFGETWVETRGEPGTATHQVRLKPLGEFRHLLERSGEFIMIEAEEISDRSEGKPVHINATNVAEALPPAGGATVREAMQNNLRAILEHEKQHGRQVLPHLNHPNFGYAVTAEDIAAVVSERFFEVYNGHLGVNHLGDDTHVSVERIWDLANAIRRDKLNVPPLMGIATDDSHEYHGLPGSHPGRGWVMVRSRFLTPEHLIRAMKRGDFYASSGVELSDIRFDQQARTLSLAIKGEKGVSYQTEFISTLGSDGKTEKIDPDQIGKVVSATTDLNPSYTMQPGQLYLRAVVTSDAAPDDPSFKGQYQQAWTQPVGWREAE